MRCTGAGECADPATTSSRLSAAAIAILIGFSLVVLLNLSYPFSGDLAIDPDSFKDGVLAQFASGS